MSHTQIFAFLAMSGFEELEPDEMTRAKGAFEKNSIEDEKLEEIFFKRGYLSLTFFDISNNTDYRDISIKSGLEPNRKAVRPLKRLLDLGLDATPKKMGAVKIFFKDHHHATLHNFYDLADLGGFRSWSRESNFSETFVFTPVLKEKTEKGGAGSGHHGHSGLPGVHGGSRPSKGGGVTQTPEFKRWFGDSKVIDENGNPKVTYHGTDADFQEFIKNRGLTGYHFGTSEQAEFRIGGKMPPYYEGANIIPAYLSIQNPIELNDHDWDTMENLIDVLSKRKIRVPQEMSSVAKRFSELKKPDLFDDRADHDYYWEKYHK